MGWPETIARQMLGDRIKDQHQSGSPHDKNENILSDADTACQPDVSPSTSRTSEKPSPVRNFRQSGPDKNKLEQKYEEHLWMRMIAGEVLDFRFGALRLRLARNTFYAPDFIVVTPQEIQIHETKGHQEDDARVKIKAAAREYFYFRFFQIRLTDNEWKFEEILPG